MLYRNHTPTTWYDLTPEERATIFSTYKQVAGMTRAQVLRAVAGRAITLHRDEAGKVHALDHIALPAFRAA
jgi:chlorite dismutase